MFESPLPLVQRPPSAKQVSELCEQVAIDGRLDDAIFTTNPRVSNFRSCKKHGWPIFCQLLTYQITYELRCSKVVKAPRAIGQSNLIDRYALMPSVDGIETRKAKKLPDNGKVAAKWNVPSSSSATFANWGN